MRELILRIDEERMREILDPIFRQVENLSNDERLALFRQYCIACGSPEHHFVCPPIEPTTYAAKP